MVFTLHALRVRLKDDADHWQQEWCSQDGHSNQGGVAAERNHLHRRCLHHSFQVLADPPTVADISRPGE